MERIYLFDTTLRDGQQTQGVQFSLDDKHRVAQALDLMGIDYIEGGWPGANPTDSEFFEKSPKLDKSIFTAFGMTKSLVDQLKMIAFWHQWLMLELEQFAWLERLMIIMSKRCLVSQMKKT